MGLGGRGTVRASSETTRYVSNANGQVERLRQIRWIISTPTAAIMQSSGARATTKPYAQRATQGTSSVLRREGKTNTEAVAWMVRPWTPTIFGMIDTKVCSKCRKEKAVMEFGPYRGGLHSHCRRCKCDAEIARRLADVDGARARDREYRARDLNYFRARDRLTGAKRRSTPGFNEAARKAETERLRRAHQARAIERECAACAVKFCPVFGKNNYAQIRFCSPPCETSATNQRSRLRTARVAEAYVEDVSLPYLMVRDGGRCQLCRKKVRPGVKVPHRLAPTLDHIVPLSLGGRHEKANAQLACFRCNPGKGNRAMGEQLLLIG